jgi:hypothetical protein
MSLRKAFKKFRRDIIANLALFFPEIPQLGKSPILIYRSYLFLLGNEPGCIGAG